MVAVAVTVVVVVAVTAVAVVCTSLLPSRLEVEQLWAAFLGL